MDIYAFQQKERSDYTELTKKSTSNIMKSWLHGRPYSGESQWWGWRCIGRPTPGKRDCPLHLTVLVYLGIASTFVQTAQSG